MKIQKLFREDIDPFTGEETDTYDKQQKEKEVKSVLTMQTSDEAEKAIQDNLKNKQYDKDQNSLVTDVQQLISLWQKGA